MASPSIKAGARVLAKSGKQPTKNGINHNVKAYASRIVENATRIASLFAWFNGKNAIGIDDIQGAIDIVEYSASERRRYDDITTDITDAEKLLQWLLKKAKETNQDKFYLSYLQTSVTPQYLRIKQTLETALELLSDSNYIYLDTETTNRRPKRVIELNPALLQ